MNAPLAHPVGDDPYLDFLRRKMQLAKADGFDVAPEEINPAGAPHCRAIVRWALKGGSRAIFASFGLHKTFMQIELMRLIGKFAPGFRLIVIPLGVRHEFFDEAAERFQGDFGVTLKFIRSNAEIEGEDLIYLTNYESVLAGKIDVSRFVAASLDEAAVLRGYGTKTFQTFLPLFKSVRFKFVATATPSPNRTKELIHYAGFLGVMDTGQALTRFFQRNSESAGDLTLFPHKEDEFWLWVHSWAVFLQSPADLGFDDIGYVLPAVTVNWHEVPIDHSTAGYDRDGQGLLIRNTALGVTQASAAKRDSLPARIAKMSDLLAQDPEAHSVLWHDLEDERRAIEAAVPGVRSNATRPAMADPLDRARFAATVRRRLDGISTRAAVATWPTLNAAMISRARNGENLTIGSFLALCKALRLRPLDFHVDGAKRRRVTRKTILGQAVTASVPCETGGHRNA